MKANTAAAVLLISTAIFPAAASAEGFRSIAKELARAARRAKVARVAVLPFKDAADAGGDGSADGAAIAERITTRFVEQRGIQIIERSMLQALMSEHRLERTGLVAAGAAKPLGRVAAADAIVAGSYTVIGPRVVVDARLIDMETGVILAAAEQTVERDWSEGATLWVPAPEFIAEVPPLPSFSGESDLRDAVASNEPESCANASSRVDDMERGILELKARYWAGKLREGTSLRSLKSNPGSTISDPELRRAFYERLKFWYQQAGVPGLTPAETRRFVSTDAKAYTLYQQCGA